MECLLEPEKIAQRVIIMYYKNCVNGTCLAQIEVNIRIYKIAQ